MSYPAPTHSEKGAAFDPTGTYRYALWREWDRNAPRLGFVLLNPSIADGENDDPTLRRCIGFARAWGYGSVEIVNLFAYRTSVPDTLLRVADPVGPDNERYIRAMIDNRHPIIAGWGNGGALCGCAPTVLALLLARSNTFCLGWTRKKQPCHPLYLSARTQPVALRRFESG